MSVLWWPSVATSGSPPASALSTKIGCENCTACALAGSAASSATDRTRLRRLISPLRRWTSTGTARCIMRSIASRSAGDRTASVVVDQPRVGQESAEGVAERGMELPGAQLGRLVVIRVGQRARGLDGAAEEGGVSRDQRLRQAPRVAIRGLEQLRIDLGPGVARAGARMMLEEAQSGLVDDARGRAQLADERVEQARADRLGA